MSQFRIKGIDYADEDLQHGLGIGSGRGRPKGSKNGQVMPGAAYMKNYKIVGEKAEGTDNLPEANNPSRKLVGPVNPNLQRDYNRATKKQNNTQNQSRTTNAIQRQMQNVRMVKSNSNQRGTLMQPASATEAPTTNAADNRVERTPSENVSAGRDFVQQMMRNVRTVKSNSNQQGKLVPQPEATTKDDAPGTSKDRREFVNEVLNNAPDNMDTRRQRFLGPVGATDPNQTGNTNPNSGGSGSTNQNRNQNPAGNTPKQGQTLPAQQGQTPPAGNQQGQGQTPPAGNQQGQGQTPPAQQRQETPEQKSFWDNVGGWFAQAGKDIGNTVVSALNTAGGAVSDAANWVGNRLREGGEWALASMGDVGEWVGDRAKDLDAWWNGRDIEVNDNGRTRQTHQTGAREAIEDWWNGRDTVGIQDGVYRRNHEAGARENIGNALNAVGQWIGNAAGDVGRTVGGAANTAGQWIGNAAGDVGRTVGNAANDAGRAVNEWWNGRDVEVNDNGRDRQVHQPGAREAIDDWWNGRDTVSIQDGVYRRNHEAGARENIGNALNAAGQWIGNVPGDAGRAASNLADDVLGRYQVVDTDENGNVIYGNQRQGGLVNRALLDARRGLNAAGQWAGNNIVTPVTNAANGVGNFVRDTANNAADVISATPGAAAGLSRAVASGVPLETANHLTNNYINGQITREEYEESIDRLINEGGPWGSSKPKGIGQTVSDAFNDAGRAIGNAATNVWNGAVDAANNAGRAIGDFAGNAADVISATPGAAAGLTRALTSGVPAEYASRLTNNYVNGQITREEYEDAIDRLINESGPWGP